MITDFHAKLFAHELIRHCPAGSVDRFTPALMDSQVDLNPHQVDVALFAFRSPLSKGVIFADEVGLGKAIVAGNIYITDPEHSAIVRLQSDGKLETLLKDSNIRWPDGLGYHGVYLIF